MCLTSSCTDTGHLNTPSGCLKLNQSRCFLGRVGHVRQCHTCPKCAKMQAKWASRWSTRIARMLCGYVLSTLRCPPEPARHFRNALEPFKLSSSIIWNLSRIFGSPSKPQKALAFKYLRTLHTSTSTQPSKSVFRILPEPSSCEPLWWPLNCLGKKIIGPPSSNRDSKFTSHDSLWFILIHDIAWFLAWTLKVRSWRPQPVAQFRAFGTTTRQECRTLWMPQAQTKQFKKKHDSLAMNYDVDLHCALLINLSIDLHA